MYGSVSVIIPVPLPKKCPLTTFFSLRRNSRRQRLVVGSPASFTSTDLTTLSLHIRRNVIWLSRPSTITLYLSSLSVQFSRPGIRLSLCPCVCASSDLRRRVRPIASVRENPLTGPIWPWVRQSGASRDGRSCVISRPATWRLHSGSTK